MIVTMQIQVDPLEAKEFSEDQLREMQGMMYELCNKLEKFKEYIRAEFFVNSEVWNK